MKQDEKPDLLDRIYEIEKETRPEETHFKNLPAETTKLLENIEQANDI